MTTKDEVLKMALEALEDLYAEQNAAPLWKYQEHWQAAMDKAEAAMPAIRSVLNEHCEALMPVQDGAHAPTEREQPAQRCPLCNYQHGHAIGCENNPVDIALAKMAEQPAQQEPHVHAISGLTADELWLETGRLRSELADLKAQQEPKALMQEIARLHDRIKDLERDVEFLSQPAPAPKVQEQQEPVEYWTVADGWVSEQAEVPAFVWVEPDFWEHCKRVNCGTAYRLPAPGRQPLYTSPPASKPWVHATTWRGLTDEEKSDLWCESTGRDCVNEDTHVFADAIEAKLKEKNNG